MEDRDRNIAYTPVSCDVIDQIEIFATRRKSVSFVLGNSEDQFVFKGVIKTWFTKNKVEYLQLVGDVHVRLDGLVSIDGISVNDTVCKV